MATTLLGQQRTGEPSFVLEDDRIVATHVYKYWVLSDATDEDEVVVLNTAGLPIVSVSEISSTGAFCRSKKATRHPNNAKLWDVTCEFTNDSNRQQPSSTPGADPNDPTQWIPIWKTGIETMDFYEEVDASTTPVPIRNSAGLKFSEPILKRRGVSVFDFFQYFPDTLTENTLMTYHEVVNSAAFKGFAIKSLLLTVIGSERGYYNGYAVRRVDFKVKYYKGIIDTAYKVWNGTAWAAPTSGQYSGWRELRLDVSPQYKDGSDLKPFTDALGHPIDGNLDGAGARQATGTAPAILAFDRYPSIAFASIIRT